MATVKTIKLTLPMRLYQELEALSVDSYKPPAVYVRDLLIEHVKAHRDSGQSSKPGPKSAGKSPAAQLSPRQRRGYGDKSDSDLRQEYVDAQRRFKADPRDVGAKLIMDSISNEMALRAEEDHADED